jgi:hypothetical protein
MSHHVDSTVLQSTTCLRFLDRGIKEICMLTWTVCAKRCTEHDLAILWLVNSTVTMRLHDKSIPVLLTSVSHLSMSLSCRALCSLILRACHTIKTCVYKHLCALPSRLPICRRATFHSKHNTNSQPFTGSLHPFVPYYPIKIPSQTNPSTLLQHQYNAH